MKCAAISDNLIHGRSLTILGAALNQAQQPQEALVHLDHARALLRAVGSAPSLTTTCLDIAHAHYLEWRLPEALDAIQEAWKHLESSAVLSHRACTALEFGKILFSAERDTEAWKYIEIALSCWDWRHYNYLGQSVYTLYSSA
jgi:tetratricopeptide (TPR) repeat protein